MEKINNFTITRLSVCGFKNFEELTSFDFGDMTYITAANGLGKSSIADAIAFAFAGTPFFGDGKGLDRLQNRNMREMEVCVECVDDSGSAHTLVRNRKKDNVGIIFDGYTVRQSDMTAIFGDKDMFLSIFNPLYFADVLGENGKGMLEKLLPAIDHSAVLAALPESAGKLLANESLVSPESYIKSRRAEIRKHEETIIGYKGQQELLQRQRRERTANIDEMRAMLDKINSEICELEMLRDKDRDPLADEQVLAELRQRRAELTSGTAHNAPDENILKINNQVRELELYIAEQASQPYVSKYTAQIAKAEAELNILSSEHKKLTAALNNITIGYKCSVCMSEVTEKNIDAVKSDLQKRLSVVVTDGKTARTQLNELKQQDSAAAEAFETNKSGILAIEREKLSELTHELQEYSFSQELDAQNYVEKLLSLDSKISALEYRVSAGHLSQEQARRLIDLQNFSLEYKSKLNALTDISDDTDYSEFIFQTESEITRINILVNEALLYAATRAELTFANLKMNRTQVILSEVVKTTGELKDCFRFSYDGREYKCLSLSERIKAGLELSELIKRLSGRNYPVFIDNAESICVIDNIKPTGQMIFSRVVKSEAFKVTYKNNDSNEIRKAG